MKQMLLLNFPSKVSGNSLTFDLIKTYDLEINILRASIEYNAEGFLLVDMDGSEENIHNAITFLQNSFVTVTIVNSAIKINEELCVHCGACTAVCAVDAIYMDTNWQLQFDNEKCLDCKSCVKACPARAIEAIL